MKCTWHEDIIEREDGKSVRCEFKYKKGTPKAGKQCGNFTKSVSSFCAAHDDEWNKENTVETPYGLDLLR